MSQAHAPTHPTTATPTESPQFTLTLGVSEVQALLAIVGLTRGSKLYPLYASLEDFHAAHDIERKDVAEQHDIRGFDEDNLIDWWTADEVHAGEPVSAA